MDLIVRMVKGNKTLNIRCKYLPEFYGDYMNQANYVAKEFLSLGWQLVHASITL